MRNRIFIIILLSGILVLASCASKDANSDKNLPAAEMSETDFTANESTTKFEYFYRGFAAVKYDMLDTYPRGTLVIETEEDWHDFMDKYIPGAHYDVGVDYSKECLVYNGGFPAQDIYSEAYDIKDLSLNDNKLGVEYIEHPNTGVGNGIYAQDAEGYMNIFINIIKVNKKDIPENIVNIYHKKW